MFNEDNVNSIVNQFLADFYRSRRKLSDMMHRNALEYELQAVMTKYFGLRARCMAECLKKYSREDIIEANRRFEFIRPLQVDGWYFQN